MVKMGKGLAVIAWLMILAGMTGCSSTLIKTYEGDTLEAGQAGVLQAPEDIVVKVVNGKQMKSFLMDNLALSYALKPGPNTVLFKYESIWATPKKADDYRASVEEVASGMQEIELNVQAGESYSFEFVRPQTRAEAKALAQGFQAAVVSNNGTRVVSRPYVERKDVLVAAAQPVTSSAMVPAANVAVAPTASVPVAADLSNIEAMKVIWQTASPEEKKAFLKWAFK